MHLILVPANRRNECLFVPVLRPHVQVKKKLLFEDNLYDLGELYRQIRNAHDREPYYKIEVSFNSNLEY